MSNQSKIKPLAKGSSKQTGNVSDSALSRTTMKTNFFKYVLIALFSFIVAIAPTEYYIMKKSTSNPVVYSESIMEDISFEFGLKINKYFKDLTNDNEVTVLIFNNDGYLGLKVISKNIVSLYPLFKNEKNDNFIFTNEDGYYLDIDQNRRLFLKYLPFISFDEEHQFDYAEVASCANNYRVILSIGDGLVRIIDSAKKFDSTLEEDEFAKMIGTNCFLGNNTLGFKENENYIKY